MAKPSTEAVLRAQKERKQKIFVVVAGLVLVALMAWQGPKTYKAVRGGASETPLPITTPPPGTATTPGLGTTTSASEGPLPDSDVQPEPLEGQLLSFSRFFGRDPFTAARSSSGSQAVGTTAATIEVNGTSEDLAIGDSFPASDPTFKLVAVNAQAATIGLVSGSFSNGDATISINVGETLVLQADDGARYAIKLVSLAGA
ncbi:MAG TPA: hypothetical protein VE693_02675 [Gaiellaceae bacterium]|nr:hypothetical protein [Gaiellaceae bacterium]